MNPPPTFKSVRASNGSNKPRRGDKYPSRTARFARRPLATRRKRAAVSLRTRWVVSQSVIAHSLSTKLAGEPADDLLQSGVNGRWSLQLDRSRRGRGLRRARQRTHQHRPGARTKRRQARRRGGRRAAQTRVTEWDVFAGRLDAAATGERSKRRSPEELSQPAAGGCGKRRIHVEKRARVQRRAGTGMR